MWTKTSTFNRSISRDIHLDELHALNTSKHSVCSHQSGDQPSLKLTDLAAHLQNFEPSHELSCPHCCILTDLAAHLQNCKPSHELSWPHFCILADLAAHRFTELSAKSRTVLTTLLHSDRLSTSPLHRTVGQVTNCLDHSAAF
jgi:hypothetical protein